MSKRFQTVGSLLRPEKLLAYKRQIENRDDIAYPFYNDFKGYKEVETECVKDVVNKEIEHGLIVLTDGEYTKSMWHLDFVWGLGAKRLLAPHGYYFIDKDGKTKFETRRDIKLEITKPLSGKNHHFIYIYKQLKGFAGNHDVKLTIPAPAHIFGELSWSPEILGPKGFYKTKKDLFDNLLNAYKEFVFEYAKAGGKILQCDNCLWELFASDNPNSPFTGKAVDKEEVKGLAKDFIAIDNALVDYGHSLGLKMWTHNCRGNYASRHMGGGSYIKIANLFLKQQKYDRFFLEWDDERAGTLQALKVFQDKPTTEIVLGFLSSKTHGLEDEDKIITKLNQASQIIPKSRLYLSHQCGFASCDDGNELTEAEQWAKIDKGEKIAKDYWDE